MWRSYVFPIQVASRITKPAYPLFQVTEIEPDLTHRHDIVVRLNISRYWKFKCILYRWQGGQTPTSPRARGHIREEIKLCQIPSKKYSIYSSLVTIILWISPIIDRISRQELQILVMPRFGCDMTYTSLAGTVVRRTLFEAASTLCGIFTTRQ
jgi:hypothetical protein